MRKYYRKKIAFTYHVLEQYQLRVGGLLEKTPKKQDWAEVFGHFFQFAFCKSYPKQKYNLFILCLLANLFTIKIVSFSQFQQKHLPIWQRIIQITILACLLNATY